MGFPAKLTTGFDHDEAITMVEMCRRVYRIYDFSEERNAADIYRALYSDEWEFVLGVQSYTTEGRCLIVKRKDRNQYAIAFRGSVITGAGLELTNFSYALREEMIEYKSIPGERLVPSRDARVHAGFWQSYAPLGETIILFFDVLVSSRLTHQQLIELVNQDPSEQEVSIGAIGAAVRINYGPTAETQVLGAINELLAKIRMDKPALGDASLNDLIKQSSKVEQVFTALSQAKPTGKVEMENKLEVYVTGFSLGGPLSTYCVLHLQRLWETRTNFPAFALKTYGVGSPKVGNKSFAKYYNRKLVDVSYRIENALDVAIWIPVSNAPFPWNLQLQVPGIDYVRTGDAYYANFEHVGESYRLYNLGYQNLQIDFGGPLRFTLPVPYPHGPDGYKDLLMQAKERQARLWRPVQNFMRMMLQEQNQQLAEILEMHHQLEEQLHEQQENMSSTKTVESQPDGQLAALQKQIAALQQSVDALRH